MPSRYRHLLHLNAFDGGFLRIAGVVLNDDANRSAAGLLLLEVDLLYRAILGQGAMLGGSDRCSGSLQ